MIVYQMKGALHEYKALELNGFDIAQQLNRLDELKTLINFPALNVSLKDNWGEISASFYAESPTARKKPDIIVWSASALVLNGLAFNKLKDYIEVDGEFLPIDVDGTPHYIYNCLQYAKENVEKTVTEFAEGEAVGVERLEFDDSDISERFLFKSNRQGGSILYCTSNLKALCNEFGLKGVLFDENLLSPFI
jgi:hypothetical protein